MSVARLVAFIVVGQLCLVSAAGDASAACDPLVLDSAGSPAAATFPITVPWQEVLAGDRVRLTNRHGALFFGTVEKVNRRELVLDWLDRGMSLRFRRSEVLAIALRDRLPTLASVEVEDESAAPTSLDAAPAPPREIRIRLLEVTLATGAGRDTKYHDLVAYPSHSGSLHAGLAYGARFAENRGMVVAAEAGGVQEANVSGTETWSLGVIAARAGYHGYASGLEIGWGRFQSRDPERTARGGWPSVRGWAGHRAFHVWMDSAGAIQDASSMPARFGLGHHGPRAHVRVGAIINGVPLHVVDDLGVGVLIDADVPVGEFARIGLDLRMESTAQGAAQLRIRWAPGRTRTIPVPLETP